ncbi:MAG: hypothetical protein E6K91_08980 [Thaumarchaeota archaeon]|nr:MAG: hypothetical protein E6K91_08980 [Nitrososphaerota archaeon]
MSYSDNVRYDNNESFFIVVALFSRPILIQWFTISLNVAIMDTSSADGSNGCLMDFIANIVPGCNYLIRKRDGYIDIISRVCSRTDDIITKI